MPELPEVESARRLLERVLVGRTVVAATARADAIVLDGVTPGRLGRALRGRRVIAAQRRGKHLWLELDERPWPTFHFGMSGSFRTYGHPRERPTHWKVELRTDDGQRLALRDPRRFGRVRLLADPSAEPPISLLGPDPLLALPRASELSDWLAGRRAPIKSLLLDQRLFAGVGNWVADEVLYQAGIAPQRLGGELSGEEVRRLRSRLRLILRKACDVEADSDRFPRNWLFHVRWGRQADAVTARGEKVEHLTIGGRTTAWVPAAQR